MLALIQSDRGPYKKREFGYTERPQGFADICKPMGDGSGETKSADTLILDFQPPRLWENKRLLVKPPSLGLTQRVMTEGADRCRYNIVPHPQAGSGPDSLPRCTPQLKVTANLMGSTSQICLTAESKRRAPLPTRALPAWMPTADHHREVPSHRSNNTAAASNFG